MPCAGVCSAIIAVIKQHRMDKQLEHKVCEQHPGRDGYKRRPVSFITLAQFFIFRGSRVTELVQVGYNRTRNLQFGTK